MDTPPSQIPVVAYLGLGSNLDNPAAQIAEAMQRLRDEPEITLTRTSSLYETKPVGVTDQPMFLNAVVEVQTSLTPLALLQTILALEKKMGRTRTIRWGPRVIDIDILLYGTQEVREEGLTIPHLYLAERVFALMPLAEIAPEARFPDGESAKKKLQQILKKLSETGNNLGVQRVG